MKYLKQFLILLLFTCMGEILYYFVPLPIPASVYGLILLFTSLCFGLVKTSAVQEAANFLIEIMPVMFIPASVGLINVWDKLTPILLPAILIMMISTVIVMITTGKVAMLFVKQKEVIHE